MNTTQTEAAARRPSSSIAISPAAAVLLALSLGLCGGYLDVGIILFSKWFWNNDGFSRTARDFPWTVPAGHALSAVDPGSCDRRADTSSLGSTRIRLTGERGCLRRLRFGALLGAPLSGASSLLLAAGLGRLFADAIAARGIRLRRLGLVAAALVGLLGVLAALLTGWQAVRGTVQWPDCPGAAPGGR